jgi:hypothetical protein
MIKCFIGGDRPFINNLRKGEKAIVMYRSY